MTKLTSSLLWFPLWSHVHVSSWCHINSVEVPLKMSVFSCGSLLTTHASGKSWTWGGTLFLASALASCPGGLVNIPDVHRVHIVLTYFHQPPIATDRKSVSVKWPLTVGLPSTRAGRRTDIIKPGFWRPSNPQTRGFKKLRVCIP